MTRRKIFIGLAVFLGAALAVIVKIAQVKADGAVVTMTNMETNRVKCAAGKDVCSVEKETEVSIDDNGNYKKIIREVTEYGHSLGDR